MGYVLAFASLILALWLGYVTWFENWLWRYSSSSVTGIVESRMAAFVVLPFAIASLGAIVLYVCLLPRRLDLAALRFAANRFGVHAPKFPPPASSVQVFGPFVVIGGLFGVGTLFMTSVEEMPRLENALIPLCMGLLLFLFGLALADLYRWLWRLEWLARQMSADRLYPPQEPGFLRSMLHATPIVVLAAGFFGLQASVVQFVVDFKMDLVGSLLLMGGLGAAVGWSLFRLSGMCVRCLDAWEVLIPREQEAVRRGGHVASWFWCAAAVLPGMLCANLFFSGAWHQMNVMREYESLNWIGEGMLMFSLFLAFLFLSLVPLIIHRAACVVRRLGAGRSPAGFLGLPRGWLLAAYGLLLAGGFLLSFYALLDHLDDLQRTGSYRYESSIKIYALLVIGLPLSFTVWITGLLSPIHFLVVNLESAAGEKQKEDR